MLVLGISGGFDRVHESFFQFNEDLLHDAAAVLVRDNEVIAGIEEERLNRIKHTNKVWRSSVEFCLKQGEVALTDLDAIAIYVSEDYLNMALRTLHLTRPLTDQLMDARAMYQYLFQREFGVELSRDLFQFVHHHIAHASTSYHLSGFDESLILSIDGSGDNISSMVMDVRDGQFSYLLAKPVEDSLGFFYLEVIRFLGYQIFDEYKVMGLAPYGDASVYRELISTFYELREQGDYTIHKEKILQLYDVMSPRRRHESFTQVHKDLAAGLQEALENIVFHILTYFQNTTGQTRLCITGGVGQNSSMNGKILQSGLFEEIFAPSFAADSGCAVGAALHVVRQCKPELPRQAYRHAYWGTPLPDKRQIETELESWHNFVDVKIMPDRSSEVAELIAKGSVIGWVQGRSEFGPRALGNRSIIADPRLASHKETINAMIKKREGYRPFAPSVLAERVTDFFEVPGKSCDFPFMSCVLKVVPDKQELLAAITHVDGTARLQTVDRHANPEYWSLINAFADITDVPMLLNTSFNNNAEPIVDNVRDAVVCYLTSGLDYLVVGDYLVTKKTLSEQEYCAALADMVLTLPKAARLLEECAYNEENQTKPEQTHSIYWNYDVSRRYPLSAAAYDLLSLADGGCSLGQLLKKVSPEMDEGSVHQLLMDEINHLWSERIVTFSENRKS